MLGMAQEMKPDGVATVRAVHGMAQYSNGDQWLDAKPNLQIVAGTTLRTGADSELDLQVNGRVSQICLTGQTTAQLQRMARASAETSADTETVLDLKSGTLLGSVEKLSAKSLYQIHTPDGTATVRGTAFQIEALQQEDGSIHTKFSCMDGELFCSAVVNGQTVSQPVRAGDSWTPGDLHNGHLRPPGSQGGGATNAPLPPLSRQEIQALQKLAADYNSFGFQLLKAASKSYPKTNIFLSPLGAAFALSIARSGARGATQQEITRALQLENLPPAGIDGANEKMLDALSTLAGSLKLEIANGLWTEMKAQMKPEFIATVRNFYNGEAAAADLQSPATVGKINSWVNDHTHGTIPSIIGQLDTSTVMVLVDAVYFKALWNGPFDKALTLVKPFKLDGGGAIQHPRMKKSASFDYYENSSFQMVALPYMGSATMFVLLPKSSLAKFMQGLTPENWEKWIGSLQGRAGLLELPRFKLDNDYDLKAPLQALGIRRAFQSGQADFSGIADSPLAPLFVSVVEQKTHLELNEEGTEASAATMIVSTLGIGGPHNEPPPFKMIVDHPFFVVIRENLTGAMLFTGAIADPR
jgi:serpin B